MANESRLSITIDSRSAEQKAKDLEKALDAMDAAGVRVVSTAGKAGRSTDAAGKSFVGAGRDARKGASDVDSLNRSLTDTDKRAATAAATINRTLKAAFAGISIMHVIDAADEWGQYASRMKMATESTEEYQHAQDRMIRSAQTTFRAIRETRESFIQLSPVLREMGLTLDQSIDAVDAFSGLLVVNGANAERGAAAMEALAKSFQRGRVDAMAWMTIYSTADTIVQHLAESSGKTAAEIRQLGVEGKISAEMISKALLSAYEPVMKRVEEMPTTVRDALTNLNTSFGEYVGRANEANGSTQVLVSGINLLSENFETVADTAGKLAAGALVIYTARMISAGAAVTAKTIATVRDTNAEVARTAAVLASARANVGLTGSLGELTAAELAHEAALKRQIGVMAVARATGGALLGIFGGPVGLIATLGLGAAAYMAYSNTAQAANTSTLDLTQSTKDLTKAFTEANQARRAGMLLDAEEGLKKAEEQAKSTAEALRSLVGSSLSIAPQVDITGQAEQALTDLDAQIVQIESSSASAEDKTNAMVAAIQKVSGSIPKALTDELIRTALKAGDASQAVQDLQDKVDALRAAMSAPLPVDAGIVKTVDTLSAEYQKFEQQINRQIALTGKAGQAAQYRYDLEHGALSELTPKEKELALARVAELEAAEKAEAARRKGGKAAQQEAKEIDNLLKKLRDEASVLGMSSLEAEIHRIETAKGTEAQKAEAIALAQTIDAHKQRIELLRTEANLRAEIQTFADEQFLPITGMGMGERARQDLQREIEIRQDFAKRRRELDMGQLSESTRMSEEAYNRQVQYLADAEAAKIAIVRESVAQRNAEEQNWITGVSEGLRNYADEAGNVYQSMDQMVQNSFKGMTDALTDFVMTGKADFSDFANSIIRDMIRIMIQSQITGPLAGALGSALGGLFGPASAPAGVTPGVNWTFPRRAAGGPVSAGKMYEVNERGTPELLNVGKRQFLMMGPDGGHVTPVTAGGRGGPSVPAMAGGAPQPMKLEIINPPGMQLRGRDGGMSFNGKEYVQTLILEDIRNDGPIAQTLRGGQLRGRR